MPFRAPKLSRKSHAKVKQNTAHLRLTRYAYLNHEYLIDSTNREFGRPVILQYLLTDANSCKPYIPYRNALSYLLFARADHISNGILRGHDFQRELWFLAKAKIDSDHSV